MEGGRGPHPSVRLGRTAALVAFGCSSAPARTASAASLDPFRTARVDGGLDPFRVAQALPRRPASPEGGGHTGQRRRPRRRARPRLPSRKRRRVRRTTMSRGQHLPVERLPDVRAVDQPLPALLPRGKVHGSPPPLLGALGHARLHGGVSVLLALLLADVDSFAIAPFYWRFTDNVRQSELTVIIPFSWSHEPGAQLVRDLAAVLRVDQVRLGDPAPADFNSVTPKIGNQYGTSSGSAGGSESQKGGIDIGLAPPYVSSRDAAHAFTWAAAAELLLAQRRRREPAGAAALLPEQAQDRERGLHLARLQSPRRPRVQRVGLLAVLVRPRRREPRALRRLVPAALELPQATRRKRRSSSRWSGASAHPRRTPPSRAYFIHRRNDTLVRQRRVSALVERRSDDATGRGFKALDSVLHLAEPNGGGQSTATLVTPARRLHEGRRRGDAHRPPSGRS